MEMLSKRMKTKRNRNENMTTLQSIKQTISHLSCAGLLEHPSDLGLACMRETNKIDWEPAAMGLDSARLT